MVLVLCEPCGKRIEEGWNLTEHLRGKDHQKKFARWQQEQPVQQPVLERVIVEMPFDDDDEAPLPAPTPPQTC